MYKSIKKYEEGEKDIIELRIDMAAEGGRFIFGSGGAVAGAAAGGAIFSAILPGKLGW